ncbi:hypothetical protein AVI48_16015 (plasmid) [Piscirickettsia salmonis]|nr:hypothetical protein KW89_1p28 [Piscirickettsia salmonis]APS45935.1 hypothetical protein AVI48_16015 [Piscirickettsia salmonis]APS49321.1 hypothetical protein AVI49_16820 [Piscirickettsia salmonis]
MTCKLSSTAEHFHDDFNHRARNIIAIGHIVAPPSSASLEKMFKRELNQTNYLIVLINKRLIIQTTINYTTALLKSRAVLSEPILEGLILLKSFTSSHSNSLLISVDCYTILKSKFFATVPTLL